MHGETMQFRRACVCSFKTLLYENINLPHSNLICSRYYWTLLFAMNEIVKVSKHMLSHFEWSLSYILQIILFFSFCPTSRPINTLKPLLDISIAFHITSTKVAHLQVTWYFHHFFRPRVQGLQNWEKQKRRKRIKNANCILKGQKLFERTKKGIS